MATCTGPDCDRPARYKNPQPLCGSHYLQLWRGIKLAPLVRHRKIIDGTKECSRCGLVLPVSSFAKKDETYVQSECRDCISIKNRSARYRISFAEAKALMDRSCETCGSVDRLHVDHDHDTGKVRGVLCHNCNTVLTKHMTPDTLRRLADYLEAST